MRTQPATTEAAPPLFEYPAQAAFEKVLPKNKIYAYARPSRRVQQRFTTDVARIVWQYKLAPETIRLPARQGIQEIQVFRIVLKEDVGDNFSLDVLRSIDKAIGFPIIFEVDAADKLRVAAAFKRPSEADSAKWVLGDYFLSTWLPAGCPRTRLPVAVDLAALYRELLRRLMPYPPHDGESLREQVERIERIRLLEREYEKLQTRLGREKQFNRKVDVNREVRTVESELNELRITEARSPQE